MQALAEQMGMQVVDAGRHRDSARRARHTSPSRWRSSIASSRSAFDDNALTVATCDPQNLHDSRRAADTSWATTFASVVADRDATSARRSTRYYSPTGESVEDIIGDMENDAELKQALDEVACKAGPIDLTERRSAGRQRAGPQAAEHDAAAGDQRSRQRHSLRAVRRRVPHSHQGRRRAVRNGAAAAAPGLRDHDAHQGDGEPRHRRTPPAARRPHRADRRRSPGRLARVACCRRCSARASSCGCSIARSCRSILKQGRHGRRHAASSFREVIDKPNGIVLVTGPTGSGKTTTLYSALSELNDIEDKLITTEDPVEYDIDGIMQMPIDRDDRQHVRRLPAGHFAARPRHHSRRRDSRSGNGRNRRAGVAHRPHGVQHAAHERRPEHGHAPEATWACRTFLITATVEAILAQRLVRRICSAVPRGNQAER